MSEYDEQPAAEGIAIVGMAGRFPGAEDLRRFWRNLAEGVESIVVLSRDELLAAGADPAEIDAPGYVPAGGLLDDPELFDAAFFGLGAREAELMDPQHRLFLETSWQALEDAGYDAEVFDGSIGVYGGMNLAS
ncbi:MAG: beta-ketoacyl synthase N-terminal-like domain-containing protein, partial [Acidobacteriota bacterium]